MKNENKSAKFNKWGLGLMMGAIALLLIQGAILLQSEIAQSETNRLGQEFTLGFQETVVVEPESVELSQTEPSQFEFKLVDIEDSRCPQDVQCVWAGQAIARIEVHHNRENLGSVELTDRSGQPDLATQTIDGYSLQLTRVTPYPSTNNALEDSDYAVTLRLAKQS